MSKIKLCKNCSKEVPKSAKICPFCGAKLKMGIIKKLLLSLFAVFILLFIIGLFIPDDSNTTNNTNKSASSTSAKNNTSKAASNKADSNKSSEISFTKEESEFSPGFINSLYAKKMNYVDLKSGILSSDHFKLTLNQSKYIYYGDLKDNEPYGKGILFQRVDSNIRLFTLLYIGYFKDGNFNGFGFKYGRASENTIVQNIFSDYTSHFREIGAVYKEYEGYFKDGKFEGNGTSYQIDFGSALDLDNTSQNNINSVTSNDTFEKYFTDNNAEIQKLENSLQNLNSEFVISKLQPINSLLDYSGNFSKDEYNGKGKSYGKNKTVIYDGNFSNSLYDGKGKLYYNNGKLKYSGDFSKGKYDGTGTLYNEDGSVKYSGEWSKGDIK